MRSKANCPTISFVITLSYIYGIAGLIKYLIFGFATSRDASRVGLDDQSLRYTIPQNLSQTGLKFHIDHNVLMDLAIPPRSFIEPEKINFEKFVFVTSASSNYFKESIDMIASVQFHFPDKNIYFYDLGLTAEQRMEISKMCRVFYRHFDFDSYPGHLRDLLTYTWKPVIIQNALNEFGTIFYADSSVRISSGNLTSAYDQLTENGGLLMFADNPDFMYETTWPTMYKYLPTDASKRLTTITHNAGFIMLSRTRDIYWNIIHWWVLCALEEWCMAPKLDKEMCTTSKIPREKRIGLFGRCHRYDQSAMNILAANYFRYDKTKYVARKVVGSIKRKVTSDFKIQMCG